MVRFGIFSTALLVLLNCSKENNTSTYKESAKTSESVTKDILRHSLAEDQGIFNFQTELCDNKGYFDKSKYSEKEIKDTYILWFRLTGTVLLNAPSVFGLDDLEKVRQNKDEILTKLDKDFNRQKNVIRNLKVVNTPYWEHVKKETYKDLLQEYQKRKTEITTFSTPSVLLSYPPSGTCEKFVKALNSDDLTMEQEWSRLRIEMSKRNGDPQRITDEFEERRNSPDKRDYAIIDLITFGWGNCANEKISDIRHDEKMNNEFNALFIKIDSECDEP